MKKIKIKYITLLAFLITCLSSSFAQYCTSNPTSNAYESISRVYLQGNTILLDNVSNTFPTTVCETYTDNTSLQPVDLSAGAVYSLRVTSTTCTGTTFYTHRCLAWIDYNQNNVFESSEAVATTALVANTTPFNFVFNFTVPCNIKPGNTRMRIVMIEGALANPGNSCGTYTWGETEDYTVNLQLPTTLSAGFIAPNSAWVKSVVKFVNSNPSGYISHSWDANNDGSVEAPNSTNFNYTWASGGSKCVKLKSTNCLGSDSVIKCLTVNTPTAIPSANFVADQVIVEQYQTAKFFDLSSNGPYQWAWKVYDSSNVNDVKDIPSGDVIPDPWGNGAHEFTANPEFSFERPGCYTVELVSKNDVGSSVVKRKFCYITVIMPTEYSLGYGTYGPNSDNVVESSTGTIYDNGGKTGNYSNNQGLGTRSFLRITPCNAKKIVLTMTQLKFNGPGDKLRVWDGKAPGGPNTVLLATWSNTSKATQSVTALSGSMYILFESDASGVDSGFAGTYTSELAPATVATPSFTASSTPLYNSSPALFTNTTQGVNGVPGWEWSVDNNPLGSNKDFNYTFYTDGQYKVCLEIQSCAGNKKSCQTFDVITPNSQVLLNLTASNRRPEVSNTVVALKPSTDAANRFEWTIFPTTYTLVNPPSSPSTYGPGYIRYNSTPGDSLPSPMIRFTSPGCYTIALKAYNSLDPVNTTKTVVKNNFVCAVDYCNPSSFILAADLGINLVKIFDGQTELLSHNSASGQSAYTDYSAVTNANLTFGKTYSLEVSRNTNADPANRKAWIDWNIDGDFDDANEQILIEPSTYDKLTTVNFTVPNIKNAFEGKTVMRIGINFDNENTVPCGPVVAGEYKDYGIFLYNDLMKPVITLKGLDTVYLEVGKHYKDSGASAFDASEGDISNKIVSSSDVDTSVTGIYRVEYNVSDQSGNAAETVSRVVVVVNDLTPPVLVLNPSAPGCLEVNRNNGPYIDPGAVAYNTNPFVVLNGAIRVSGFVDTRHVGEYKLVYRVQDYAGNITTAERSVCVVDRIAPQIKIVSDTLIQIGSVWINQAYAEDQYDNNPKLHTNWSPLAVNANIKGTYTATYTAEDSSKNMSAPLVVNYRVDDFIPPVIHLNTFDVVEHDVTKVYESVEATVSDNYYGAGQLSVVRISSNVDYKKVGVYQEVFKAVDGSNNVSFKTRTVKVIDRFAPELWGGTIYGCVGENIWPMWGLSTKDNYYGPEVLLPLVEIVSQNVNPWEEGNYYITYQVTDPSDNQSIALTRQVIYTYWPKCTHSTTSLNTVENEELVVYPNPGHGIITVDLKGKVANQAVIHVYNSLGQQVMSQSFSEGKSLFELDLTHLSQGIYTVQLVSEGISFNKQIIIQ